MKLGHGSESVFHNTPDFDGGTKFRPLATTASLERKTCLRWEEYEAFIESLMARTQDKMRYETDWLK